MSATEVAATSAQANRGSLFVEDAEVISVTPWPGDQFVVRLSSPKCAGAAIPGSFVHLQSDESIPMRRPLSIMRVDASGGWIEILFKIVGHGLRALGARKPGDIVSSIGPIGRGFVPHANRPAPLLIGGGVGIPPMVFLAESLKDDDVEWRPLVIMGSEIPFPFEVKHSDLSVPWLDGSVNGTMPLIESWNIPTRLASQADIGGTYRGFVTDLAREWLSTLSDDERKDVEIFTCGPTPMLKAVTALARDFDLPCQVSLEEFMACAVGGCAGCTVLAHTDDGPAMKRVCVDGPVFDAYTIYPD